MKRVAIVGGGAVGRTLGRRLVGAGWRVGDVACRTPAHARAAVRFIGAGRPVVKADLAGASLVLVTVPDDAIERVARSLRVPKAALVVHTSGGLPSSILRARRRASIHPMRSFADPEIAVRDFPGTFCFYEGDPGARAVIEAVGGIPERLSTKGKALYHAGAVFASNYVVAAIDQAMKLLRAAGVRDPAGPILTMARGTLSNIASVGLPKALTGPIERGDVECVRRHVAALRGEARALYVALGRATVGVARAKRSIPPAVAAKLLKVLKG